MVRLTLKGSAGSKVRFPLLAKVEVVGLVAKGTDALVAINQVAQARGLTLSEAYTKYATAYASRFRKEINAALVDADASLIEAVRVAGIETEEVPGPTETPNA